MFWSPPTPIHNKKIFSDQHWRYVQKYDHLKARFIIVTYHIKVFSLFAIDWFCSEYWGPTNNITFRESPPFPIQENPSSNFTNRHKPLEKDRVKYFIKSQTPHDTFTSLFLQ